jgi:hypothetical protein
MNLSFYGSVLITGFRLDKPRSKWHDFSHSLVLIFLISQQMSSGSEGGLRLIHFFLCRPGTFVTRVTVSVSDSCGRLAQLFPNQPVSFIFKGKHLNMNDSFATIGIKSNETVIVLPDLGRIGTSPMDRWIRMTRDSDNCHEIIPSAMDHRCKAEAMRLRDIALLKREMRPQRHRKIGPIWTKSQCECTVGTNTKSVIGETPFELSTTELPHLWWLEDD